MSKAGRRRRSTARRIDDKDQRSSLMYLAKLQTLNQKEQIAKLVSETKVTQDPPKQ